MVKEGICIDIYPYNLCYGDITSVSIITKNCFTFLIKKDHIYPDGDNIIVDLETIKTKSLS